MIFSVINKIILLIISFLIFNSCSTINVYETLKVTNYEEPKVQDFDDNNIFLNSNNNTEIDYANRRVYKELKNIKGLSHNIILENNKIFVLSKDIELLELNINTGKLISTKKLEIPINKEDRLVSFNFFENSFIAAFKSGTIIRLDKNGDLIWTYESNKILNTHLTIFEDQIISLYVDEIKGILIDDGSQIWSESYQGLPIFQAKGGHVVHFLNLLYFMLPNSKVGSIDFQLGVVNNSAFNNIELVSSINNTKDKIHIFNNYLIYLDEGKYIYVFDILENNFTFFKKEIFTGTSNIFFNNSLILKEGNFLQAINIDNKKTFWLINDKKISKNSIIIAIRNIGNNIEIFLDNGDILTINNKKLIEIKNLGVKKIKNITFDKQNIIINTQSGKIIIL